MQPQVTVHKRTYGLFGHTLNTVAGVAVGLRLPVAALDRDSILASARRTTGLTDWGDEAFIERLDQLIDAVKEAPLTSFAQVMMRQTFIRAVVNRLAIRDYFRRNPDAADIEIEDPIFVLGFPRTGTTVLQNLMCLEPERRALEFWELVAPAPRVDDFGKTKVRRIKNIERTLSMAYLLAPEMTYIHEIGAQTAEECWPLFANAFAVMNYDLQSGLESYGSFLLSHDMRGPYGEYKDTLRILQHQQPGKRLVLKCPEHLWFLDALAEVFPDSRIVWTHRDPVACIASYCSLMSMQWRTLYGSFDPLKLGPYITERFHVGVNRAMAARERIGEERFFDANFHELIADQPKMVRDIYSHFGMELAPEHASAMQDWVNSDARGDGRGKHIYRADVYGLDAPAVHAKYADYIERFGIQCK